MKLNGNELVRKLKLVALKFVAKVSKAPKVWESEEASHVEGSEDYSDDKEMAFIIKRFHYMAKKNNRFSGRSSGFRGSGSREKKEDKKGFFNYKKHGHFIAEYPELQKDKSKKGSFQKDCFINKFKKSLMETWDEIDNEEDSKKDKEKSNLSLMALHLLKQNLTQILVQSMRKKMSYASREKKSNNHEIGVSEDTLGAKSSEGRSLEARNPSEAGDSEVDPTS
ncbi:hypothetical protein KIW84_042242 [Lathyrus oleraceus]|uniref:Uncharacterized protein n=1 Tax=Pisum sativum TaxID=3888 RepID=A0A9D4XBX8_PEA|nr:hypothetical protein KIW84_042242 [Pisum sativum]